MEKKILTPEQIKLKLRDRNLRIVAQNTKLSYNRLYNFVTGSTKTTGYDLIETLSDYLIDKD